MGAAAKNAVERQSDGLRYRRLLQLGSGGMATVHLALATGNNDFNRLVVVKAVREGTAEVDELRQMFLSEARLSARLNHPNVVQVSEVVESENDVMLVMEYLDGMSLAEAYVAVGDKLALPMRLRVLCEVLRGLHYAHELTDYEGTPLGIVHRDVSPQNVYLTYDGRVKLLDFGIAKATKTAGNNETQQGVVKGRIAYMPVEQFTGDGTDRRADVYAVGCMIWEAAAGVRMWGKRTDVEILQAVWSGEIPKLGDRLRVDEELLKIVDRATAHQAADRYATAEALRRDLDAYLDKQPTATSRDVGELLSEACADKRSERQRLIAEAISRSKAESVSGSLQSIVKQVVSSAENKRSEPPKDKTRSRSLPLVIVLALLAIAVFGFVALKPKETTRAASPSPAPLVAGAHALTIQTQPGDALVFVNDQPVTGEPPVTRVTSGVEHTVRVQREGYHTDKRRIRVDADMVLTIDLEAVAPEPGVPAKTETSAESQESLAKPVPATARRASRQAARKPAAPAATEAPKTTGATANCSPPYYFKGGIKTFKPECI